LRALRAAWPDAQVTLIGLEDAASFVARFHAYLDDLMIFPGVEGMPEQPARPELMPAFFAEARARGFDLAIQMHGSGQQVNDIVDQLGAQHTAGFKPQFDSDAPSDDFMPWPGALPEPTRYTALMEFLGIPVDDLALAFPLSAQDQVDCDALVANMQLAPHRTVVIHPGARLESRRWPVERFAAVAGMLVDAGWQVAVTGSEAEQDLTASLIALAGVPVADLTGRTAGLQRHGRIPCRGRRPRAQCGGRIGQRRRAVGPAGPAPAPGVVAQRAVPAVRPSEMPHRP
jgi:ADP-heptose:LPS heptosyltransferase